MKPLAKLVIRKLREYKKSCRDQDETFLDFNEVTSHTGAMSLIKQIHRIFQGLRGKLLIFFEELLNTS